MKVKHKVYILLLFISCMQGQQTSVLKENNNVIGYNSIPQERIFMHYNSSLLFTGEHLYYKLYCFDEEKKRLTNISKIGYVAMINENGETIFKHKIRLKEGQGQGDFFIPTTVPTGNYKIVGYTRWMLNVKNHFFEGNMSILNPYQGTKNDISVEKNENNTLLTKDVGLAQSSKSKINDQQKETITFDQKAYKVRSLVSMNIKDLFSKINPGTYSISVRKKDSFPKALISSAKEFISTYNNGQIIREQKVKGASIFLPEMRGELIYGKIISIDSSYSVYERTVGISIPNKPDGVHFVTTNKNGEFVFNLSERNVNNSRLLIQVFDDNKDKFNIKINELPDIEYTKLDFYRFGVSSALKAEVIKRSVYNQIENNFYIVKPDSIVDSKIQTPFYGTEMISYNLDDYTRFETVKETVIEVVDGLWATLNKEKSKVFGLRGYYPDQEKFGYLPLVLIDGIIEQDHTKVLDSQAKNIKSIGYIRDRYYLGTKAFDGIVIIKTIQGDYHKSLKEDDVFSIQLPNLQGDKKYFKQRYSDSISYTRIPDYRSQLLWIPNLKLESKKGVVDFYTSDIPGFYEVSIEGFSDIGVPLSIKESFIVQK